MTALARSPAFKKAVALNDKFAEGYLNLGAMALAYRDYEHAEKSFQKAIELEPNVYSGFVAYGYALDGQKVKDPKKGVLAGQSFEKALALKSDIPDAVCGAGWAYSADKGSFDKAVNYLEKCKSLSTTAVVDQRLIDAKLKGIAAMQKGAAQAKTAEKRDKPKVVKGGAELLDKVSSDAAQTEGATPANAPSEGAEKK